MRVYCACFKSRSGAVLAGQPRAAFPLAGGQARPRVRASKVSLKVEKCAPAGSPGCAAARARLHRGGRGARWASGRRLSFLFKIETVEEGIGI